MRTSNVRAHPDYNANLHGLAFLFSPSFQMPRATVVLASAGNTSTA